MSDREKSPEQVRREQRLQAALRDNLKRRKAQARARAASEPDGEPPPATLDSAGIATDKSTG